MRIGRMIVLTELFSLLVLAIFVGSLAACSTIKGDIAGTKASLTATERLAHAYISQPTCKTSVSANCFNKALLPDIKKAKASAEFAVAAAEASQKSSDLAKAQAAITALRGLIPVFNQGAAK